MTNVKNFPDSERQAKENVRCFKQYRHRHFEACEELLAVELSSQWPNEILAIELRVDASWIDRKAEFSMRLYQFD